MGQEIERKFLVKNDSWKNQTAHLCRQGYISTDIHKTIRIRIFQDKGFLTVKGKNTGPSRIEFEYEIPLFDANQLIQHFCDKRIIEKNRYFVQCGEHFFEIDEFLGDNQGLIIAEIELNSIDEHFEKPDWLGREVTNDQKYYNSNLVSNPFNNW